MLCLEPGACIPVHGEGINVMNHPHLSACLGGYQFQLHGVDGAGKIVLKKRLPRNKLAGFASNLSHCLVVMESCGGANYWARVFSRCGHSVKFQPLWPQCEILKSE